MKIRKIITTVRTKMIKITITIIIIIILLLLMIIEIMVKTIIIKRIKK